MPSATGPFEGMTMFFDDGTRFVAGLAATPMIQYYDATRDEVFLKRTLVPYLREIAAFYLSYAVKNATTGLYHLPYTCAQETCDGGGSAPGNMPPARKDNHQDIAYCTQSLQKLLEYTTVGADWGPSIAQDRANWTAFLQDLVPFPLVSNRNLTVYADARNADNSARAWDSNVGYAISH